MQGSMGPTGDSRPCSPLRSDTRVSGCSKAQARLWTSGMSLPPRCDVHAAWHRRRRRPYHPAPGFFLPVLEATHPLLARFASERRSHCYISHHLSFCRNLYSQVCHNHRKDCACTGTAMTGERFFALVWNGFLTPILREQRHCGVYSPSFDFFFWCFSATGRVGISRDQCVIADGSGWSERYARDTVGDSRSSPLAVPHQPRGVLLH